MFKINKNGNKISKQPERNKPDEHIRVTE
jgi:hypothetical protein